MYQLWQYLEASAFVGDCLLCSKNKTHKNEVQFSTITTAFSVTFFDISEECRISVNYVNRGSFFGPHSV